MILVVIVLAVTLWTPPIFLVVFSSAVSAIAANEFLYNTGLVKNGRMRLYTMIMAFLVPFWCYFGSNGPLALLGLMVFYILLALELLISRTKIPFAQVGFCLVGGLLFPYLISSLVRISAREYGWYMVMLPFTISFMTDIGAYLVGITLGRHKLCPTVSPKKTVEGFFGGILFAMIGVIIFAVALQVFFGFRVNYFYAVLYGGASVHFSGNAEAGSRGRRLCEAFWRSQRRPPFTDAVPDFRSVALSDEDPQYLPELH